jgi:DNA-binding transcriptional LysR family regulator
MDRLEVMALLARVVEEGSLSAAGRRLGIPLPTLSRKISDLEAHLGARLLNRTTRSLTLTDGGAAYLEAAKRILDLVGDAERAAAGEFLAPKGDLVVTAPVVFGRWHVLPVVLEFLARFPQIDVRLVLSDRNAQLVEDMIDMAVRIGSLPDSSLTATRVGSVRRMVCASPQWLAEHGAPARPMDLASAPCVAFDAIGIADVWTFRSSDKKRLVPVPVRSRLVVNTVEAALDAAIAGLGPVRLLSYQVAPAIAQSKLRPLLTDFEPEPLPVSLVHAGQGRLPLKMRRFLDHSASRLRTVLAAIGMED